MASPSLEPLASKSEERRFLLKIVGVLLALVLVFWLAVSWKQGSDASRFPRVKLSDGTWLVARAVTTGTKHSFEQPYPLDVQFRRWSRSYTESHSTTTPRMVIWLTRENDRGEPLDLDWFARCEIVVSDDFVLPANQYHSQTLQPFGSSGSGTGSSGYSDAKPLGATQKKEMIALVHCNFPLVRPRDGKLRLAVYDGTKNVVAQLDLPYPALPVVPTDDWQPESLPATKTVGNVEVTLTGVQCRRHEGRYGFSVSPQIELLHDGQPSNTWNPVVELSDPLGNVAYAWNCDLSPLESVWKLRMTLTQNSNGRFTPQEIKTLPLKPLTERRQLVHLSESHTINGTTVRLLGLGGQGPMEFTLPNSTSQFKTKEYQAGQHGSGMSSSCSGNQCTVEFYSGSPFLITSDSASQNMNNVQLIVRDQAGESLPVQGSSGTQGLMFWFFDPKPTSTSVEFQFIVQQQRQVEFLIAPPKPDQVGKAE